MNVPEHIWRFSTRDSITSLAKRLNVPNDPAMQDWAWEIADSTRINEYIELYNSDALDDDERFTLMEIIIQSFADLDTNLEDDSRWRLILDSLDRNIQLHAHSICYWAADADGVQVNDGWTVSPFLLKLVSKHTEIFTAPNGG